MPKKPSFDLDAAHHYFSTSCFNKTWDYMEKYDRSEEDDLAMLHTSMASLWHWSQRADCTAENLSIGYWQVSRVYALLGQAGTAIHYAELALRASRMENVPTFCLGYAHEALARASRLAGDQDAMLLHLKEARAVMTQMKDKEDRERLLADLATIG